MVRSTNSLVALGMLSFGILGGSVFMFVKLLVGELTPLQVVAGRVGMGALALLIVMVVTKSTPKLSGRLLVGAANLAAIDTVGPYLLITWSQLHVSSSTAALLVSTMPLFTTLIAMINARDERVTPTVTAGLICGFSGVAVLAGPEALAVSDGAALGAFAVVLAAACYAAGAVYSRTLLRQANAIGLSAIKLTIAAMVLVPATTVTDGLTGYASLSDEAWIGLAVVGFGSTGLGRCVYQWIIATAGSVRASMVTYIIPVVALILGWAVLGEPIEASTLAGALLIIAGVAGAMYGSKLQTLWTRRVSESAKVQTPSSVPSVARRVA